MKTETESRKLQCFTATRRPLQMLLLLIIAAMGLGLPNLGHATVLARYNFTGQPGNQVSTPVSVTDPNVSASAITRGSGIVAQSAANSMNSSGWTTSSSLDLTDYYEMTLTPKPGYAVTLNTLYYGYKSSSSTGPRTMTIRTSLDNYASDLRFYPSSLTRGSDMSITEYDEAYWNPGLANQTNAITFRFYGYYSQSGTWQLQNNTTAGGMVFDGDIIPTTPKHFFQQNLLPPTNGMYVSPAQWHAMYQNGIIISNIAHRVFTAGILPPPPGGPVTHTFGSTLEFELSLNSGLTWSPVIMPVTTTVLIGSNSTSSGYSVYTNRMTGLTGSGGGVQIRQSPSLVSQGQTCIKPIQGGYMISSFFDIYTEVSTDGGVSWKPATNGPAHVELKVDPALVAAAPAPRTVLPMPNGQYISPAAWHQLYQSGIVIKDIRHKLFTDWMEPPTFGYTNTHTFNSQLDFQLSQDGGLSFTAARVPNATMTVKISNVRGFQGRSTYETEVTQLDISGGDLPQMVHVRLSTNNPTTGGTSMLAGGGGGGAGGGAAISSFFDIFTEVSTDGGSSWNPATNGPAHMELRRISLAYTFTNNLLPVLTGRYVSVPLSYGYYPNGIVISNVLHHTFSVAIPPPLPGDTTNDTFNSQVEFDVSQDNGHTFTHATAPAIVTVQITCRLGDDGITEYYDAEMTELEISGGSLPPGVKIRESPTKQSLGRTTSSAVGGTGAGGYQIDSFFDIFTEASTDYGQTWQPSFAGPHPVTLEPWSNLVPPTPVTITSIKPLVGPGAQVQITYTGGSGSQFVLLKSTSITAPRSSWARVATNPTTPGTFIIPALGSEDTVFYSIKSE
jgi:hypothetical protein